MPNTKQALALVLEAVKKSPQGITSFDLMEATGLARTTVQDKLLKLTNAGVLIKHQGKASFPCVWTYGKTEKAITTKAREKKKPDVVPPRRLDFKPQTYKPEPWSIEVARPTAFDHEDCGSLQPDGSVKPRTRPIHACTGTLKDSKPHFRD